MILKTILDIKFIMLIEDAKKVEDCMKIFINKYKFRGNQELYKIDLDTLKNVVFDCAILNENFNETIKNNKDLESYIVYNEEEEEEEEYLDKDDNIIGYDMVKKTSKKKSKKTSRKKSKKTSKKTSKKKSKKNNKKTSKKKSKKTSRKKSKK